MTPSHAIRILWFVATRHAIGVHIPFIANNWRVITVRQSILARYSEVLQLLRQLLIRDVAAKCIWAGSCQLPHVLRLKLLSLEM